MSAVLMSIRPEWIEKIRSGEKTVEVRKSRPAQLDEPFTVYMYCTRPEERILTWVYPGEKIGGDVYDGPKFPVTVYREVNAGMWIFGKWGVVVGEFVCGGIERYLHFGIKPNYRYKPMLGEAPYEAMCLTERELTAYGGGRGVLYGWQITDVRMYDKAKPLESFNVKRPPQSWMYTKGPERE